jgi:energy-converting hydrogenase Eha subunit H
VKDWILDQFMNFNLITIIVMVTFVTTMSKANTTKQLKAQSEEFYKEMEEVKDEIRGQHNSLADLINSKKN